MSLSFLLDKILPYKLILVPHIVHPEVDSSYKQGKKTKRFSSVEERNIVLERYLALGSTHIGFSGEKKGLEDARPLSYFRKGIEEGNIQYICFSRLEKKMSKPQFCKVFIHPDYEKYFTTGR